MNSGLRIVHAADLHLGFRQYDRITAGGVNQRENDVARSFDAMIAKTIEIAPDVIVLAGDIFHMVRPGNRAIVHALRGFERLHAALPNVPVVMVAGNHDTPRSADVGGILRLFESAGVTVVDGAPRTIELPELDLAILAVPDSLHGRPKLTPTVTRRFNVLLLHGETGGISPLKTMRDKEIQPEDLHLAAWDYIALGHYHVYREVASNAWYSGAIDYTTSNIWGEHVEEAERGLTGKGIVERNLITGEQTFHELPRTRHFIDLPTFDTVGLSPAEIDAAIADLMASIPGGYEGKVIRLVLELAAHTHKEMDHKALRRFRTRALQFQLTMRRPERQESLVHAAVRRGLPLENIVMEMLKTRVLPSDLDRDAFVEMGTDYCVQAEIMEPKKVTVTHTPESRAAVLAFAQQQMAQADPYAAGDTSLDGLFAAIPGSRELVSALPLEREA